MGKNTKSISVIEKVNIIYNNKKRLKGAYTSSISTINNIHDLENIQYLGKTKNAWKNRELTLRKYHHVSHGDKKEVVFDEYINTYDFHIN